MGRGSSSSRGSSRSSSSRGSSRSSWSSSRGSSRSSWRSSHSRGTTIIWHSSGSGGGHVDGSVACKILGIFLIIFGAFMLLISVPSLFGGFDYKSVSAKCVDNQQVSGWYYTIYEYEVDGKEYVSRSTEGWEFPEDEGKIVEIYYLKDDPSVITEENPGSSTSDIIILIVGVAMVGGGIGLLKLSKKVKNNNQEEQLSTDQEQETIEQPTYSRVKCKYCGAKYGASESSCPSCGAKHNE